MDAPAAPPLVRLTEDDLYRRSTQYKHWSFTPAQLAALRQKTNIQASERVKANVARQRAQRAKNLDPVSASESSRGNTPGVENGSGGAGNGGAVGDKEVDCLTVAEEITILDKFCQTVLELGEYVSTVKLRDHYVTITPEIIATTIQYLRRFYLYNSQMTYPGKKILQTAMFIAYKTEFTHMPAETWSEIIPRSTPDQILAPEHLIIQALRFNLEIRHPFRALKGASIELSEMLKGTYVPLPWDTRTPTDIQSAILKLPKRTDSVPVELSQKEFRKRLEYDYGLASHILKTSAQLTDAYFHYTPSQIMFAAHLLADEPLTLFLLSAKIPSDSPVAVRTLDTIRACAAMLSSHHSYTSSDTTAPDKEAREAEVKRIMDKLKLCRDPDKVDLVKLNEAHKRDAMQDGQLDERKAKRRKLDREAAQKEADDFFGPELPKNG